MSVNHNLHGIEKLHLQTFVLYIWDTGLPNFRSNQLLGVLDIVSNLPHLRQ